MERRKKQKDHEAAIRAIIIEDKCQAEAAKIKEKKEEKEIQTWETLQRFKRNEYNKQVELEDLIEKRNKKINYAKDLQKHMVRKITIKRFKKDIKINVFLFRNYEERNVNTRNNSTMISMK